MFLYPLFANIEFYYEKTKFVMVASCSGALLNILLNYIFIGLYGYYAAGYTTLICYMVFSFAHYLAYKKIVDNNLELEKIYDIKFSIIWFCVGNDGHNDSGLFIHLATIHNSACYGDCPI